MTKTTRTMSETSPQSRCAYSSILPVLVSILSVASFSQFDNLVSCSDTLLFCSHRFVKPFTTMSEGTKPRGGGGRGGKRGRGRSGGDGKGSGASRGGRGGRGGKNSDGRPNGRGKGEKQALSLDEQLALHPYSHALHQAHIASLKESDASEADQDQAYEMYNAYLPLSPQLWAEWIERKKNALDINNEEHLEGIVEVLELYKRGCAESLCACTMIYEREATMADCADRML